MEGFKKEIKERCQASMGEYGSDMVLSCVERDIKALISLAEQYDKNKQYIDIYKRCAKSMKEYGYDMILSCSERDIKAAKALENF